MNSLRKDKKMKLWNKKNKNENRNEENAQIKPSESLGSVLSESVPAVALDIIRKNRPFHLPDKENGDSCYLVMTLDVTDIGGLNKHMKHDPDKGQLIECINCGNIDAYISEKGISENRFVIIPTLKSLNSLSEFSFLAKRDRFDQFIPTYVVVDRNGNMVLETIEARTDFSWFFDICKGRISVLESLRELTG